MTDEDELDYDQLDPGIRNVVRWLNESGFVTTDSGDGSKADHMECALPFPNVHIRVRQPRDLVAETHRLLRLCYDRGIRMGPVTEELGESPSIQASYDPCDESATISLFGVDDSMLVREEN